jgi:urate oxidase
VKHEIRYGKADVKVYRTYAEPLTGVTPIPESPFSGRDNALTAAEIEVIVRGTQFLDAYTRGDNRLVVATDTMKNFIHAVSLRARARTLEEWLLEVGTAFLDTYPHMERLTMLGRDLPFPSAVVPAADGDGFETSDRLFRRDRCDHGTARLELERDGDGDGSVVITDHESGRRELQLIKITGSAFADFARDEHTTLPERPDRPLYIWCNVGWRYADASHAVLADPARYVAAEQVADLAVAVFHEFVSLSIQHLVNEIGLRMLDRWPQLAEVRFDTQNRLWDVGTESTDDPRVKTYADPRPPYGHIGLVLRRE